MHRYLPRAIPRLLPFILFVTTPVSAQGFWVHDGMAIQVKPPSKWTYLGAEGDRGCLRAMFCAPRDYKTKAGKNAPHTPTMRLLFFAKSNAEDAARLKTEEGWPRRSTYKDTADYLARSHGKGGKQVGVEAGTFGKFQGRQTQMEYPELFGGITTVVSSIETEKGELAIEFEVLTEQFKRMRGSFTKSLSTLTPVPANKVKPRPQVETPKWESDIKAWQKMSAADRKKYRQDWGKKWLARKKAAYEPGYKQKQSKHFLILSRTNSKFTKRITQAVLASNAWASQRLAKVSDDVLMPAVVRIFDSRREMNTYRQREPNPLEYNEKRREIYAFKDASIGNLGDGYGPVIRGVFQQILHDKHPLVLRNLPRWLDNGLWLYMEGSRIVKGKKLIFFPHDVELGRFKILAERKQPQNTWWFIQEKMVETPKDGAVEPEWGYKMECARLLRWFDEDGSKVFKKDDMLVAYLAQVGKSAIDFRPRPDLEVAWALTSTSEGNEVRKAAYKRRDEFLVKVNTALVPLSADAWKETDKAFQAFNAEFAKRKFKKK